MSLNIPAWLPLFTSAQLLRSVWPEVFGKTIWNPYRPLQSEPHNDPLVFFKPPGSLLDLDSSNANSSAPTTATTASSDLWGDFDPVSSKWEKIHFVFLPLYLSVNFCSTFFLFCFPHISPCQAGQPPLLVCHFLMAFVLSQRCSHPPNPPPPSFSLFFHWCSGSLVYILMFKFCLCLFFSPLSVLLVYFYCREYILELWSW